MAAADDSRGGEAAIVTQFVASIPSRCSACHGSVAVTKEAVLRLFNNGADELAAVCPFCKAATCLGCGQMITATSEKLGKKASNGIQLTWHCEAARLALTWAYLTGYDAHLAATRQSNASLKLTRTNKRGKYRDDSGVGYSLDSNYDGYPAGLAGMDPYLASGLHVGVDLSSDKLVYTHLSPSSFAPYASSHATSPVPGQPAEVSYYGPTGQELTAKEFYNLTNPTSTSPAGANIVRSPSAPPTTSAKAPPLASPAPKYHHPGLSWFINGLPEPALSESKKPAMPAEEPPTSHSNAPTSKSSEPNTKSDSKKKKKKKVSKAASKAPASCEFPVEPNPYLDPFYSMDVAPGAGGPGVHWGPALAASDASHIATPLSHHPNGQNETLQNFHPPSAGHYPQHESLQSFHTPPAGQYPSLTAKFPYAPPNISIPSNKGAVQTGEIQLKKLALTTPSLGYSPLACDDVEGSHSKDYASFPPCNPPLNPRKRPSRPQTPERIDPEDAPTTKVLTVLIALLPSRDEQPVATALDQDPPRALTSLLRCSTIFDKVAELLHNGSLEDAARRSDLYHALLHFVRLLAYGPDRITAILYEPRALDKRGHDLSRVSFDSSVRLQSETDDYGKPLSICMSSLTNQSEMLRKTAAAYPHEFVHEEGHAILAMCADIETTAAIVAKRAVVVGSPAHQVSTDVEKDPYAWQKDVAVLAVPDEEIFAQHNYASDARGLVHATVGRIRRIINEITSLKANLPPNIFIRYGESRPDVLKVVIVGPAGTPYENGLFEFDVLCPADYPGSPPKMHLRTTGGGRVGFNPNLYPSGYVCLSLLGTWSGEKWQPGKSTMMQIFVSIQAMIFCEEPWCNEPGREGDAGSSRSRRFNRGLHREVIRYGMLEWIDGKTTQTSPRKKYALSDQSLSDMDLPLSGLDALRRSPAREEPKQSGHGVALFKEVVTKHFEEQRKQIIKTVNAWVADYIHALQQVRKDDAYPPLDTWYDEEEYVQLSKKKKPKKSKTGGVQMGAPTPVMTPATTPATLYAKYTKGEAMTPALTPATLYAKYTKGEAKASTKAPTPAPPSTTKAADTFSVGKKLAITAALPSTKTPASNPPTEPKEKAKTNVEMVATDAPLREHLEQALEDYDTRGSMRRRGQRDSMEAEPASSPYDMPTPFAGLTPFDESDL